MQRIVKFETTLGPIYLDLEEVAMVQFGRSLINGEDTIVVNLKSGVDKVFNETFKADIERYMDAWAAYKNKLWINN